jgi:hypothetical protein
MDKNREIYFQEQPNKSTVAEILRESEIIMRKGNRRDAYELTLKATQMDPQNVEAWWLRATQAPSLEERVMSVNRVNELDPDSDRHHLSFFTIKEALEQDPFLAYHGETDDLYRAVNAEQVLMSIPKQRARVEQGFLSLTDAWLNLSGNVSSGNGGTCVAQRRGQRTDNGG